MGVEKRRIVLAEELILNCGVHRSTVAQIASMIDSLKQGIVVPAV